MHQSATVEIEIIGEASQVHRHTSAMLDLKTRANELEFFNIIVDESPIIPYEIYRRYVSGSPKGFMTISGDTIGIYSWMKSNQTENSFTDILYF